MSLQDLEYMNKAGCYEVPTIDDVELYNEVAESFQVCKESECLSNKGIS